MHGKLMAEVGAVLAFRILTTNCQVHRPILVHVRMFLGCYWFNRRSIIGLTELPLFRPRGLGVTGSKL